MSRKKTANETEFDRERASEKQRERIKDKTVNEKEFKRKSK